MRCFHYSVLKLMLRCNVFSKITYENNENEITALKKRGKCNKENALK